LRETCIAPKNRVGPLLAKGSLAVTDQALFAGANFLISLLLARHLTPAEYGAFSLANSGFLLLAALHQAFVIEPMMVFGAGRFRDHFARYLRLVWVLHAAIMIPLSVVMWAIALVVGRTYSRSIEHALAAVALSSTFILLFWIVRRAFYILLKPAWGLASSAAYLIILSALAAVLSRRDLLSSFTGFAAMGVAGILASLIVVPRLPMRDDSGALDFREAARAHWEYGRWASASALMSWFPSNIYYLILAAWLGLSGAAALRALTNLIMPLQQAITAVNLLMIPSLVRDVREGGAPKMIRSMKLFAELYLGGCTIYLVALWLFRTQIFDWVYAGRYAEYAGLPLLLAAGLPIGTAAYSVLGNGLRALERPDRMTWAFLASTVASIAFGIPLTAKFGVAGALAGNHCSALLFVAALWWMLRRLVAARQPVFEQAAAE
jgi:O-antigen/teichoic acid export membrane protein